MLPQATSEKIVLSIDIDYFFAQCEEVRTPELVGRPIVICVYSGRTDESGVVSTANYIARGFGIKSGIPIANAKRILKNVLQAVFLPLDLDYYEAVSDGVMQILRSGHPVVEKVSIDEAFLDITSECSRDYETARGLANRIKLEIKERTSLTCSLGIAPNKLLAKMASDSHKPDGLTVLPPDKVKTFLENMPVRKLIGVGPKIETKMNSLGINTIGDLASFDESKLSSEFGKNMGPRLKLLAQGIDEEPVKERSAEQYSRIITLKADADSFSFREELKPLTEDLSSRLKDAGRKCRTIGIIYITSTIRLRNRSRTIDRPTYSSGEILCHASSLFEELFASKEMVNLKIRRVGIRVSGLSSGDEREPGSSGQLSDYFG